MAIIQVPSKSKQEKSKELLMALLQDLPCVSKVAPINTLSFVANLYSCYGKRLDEWRHIVSSRINQLSYNELEELTSKHEFINYAIKLKRSYLENYNERAHYEIKYIFDNYLTNYKLLGDPLFEKNINLLERLSKLENKILILLINPSITYIEISDILDIEIDTVRLTVSHLSRSPYSLAVRGRESRLSKLGFNYLKFCGYLQEFNRYSKYYSE